VHPAGGNVLCYSDLSRHLDSGRPFFGLQSPGLHENQELLNGVEDMAQLYIEALRSVQPEGPYDLGGWSMGGVVAYEMARRLRQQGHKVDNLILIDVAAPSKNRAPQASDRASLLMSFARDLGLPPGRIDLPQRKLNQMGPDEQLKYILREARDADLIDPDLGFQQISQLLKVFENNVRAVGDYVPQASPGNLTLLVASERLTKPVEDATLGWGSLVAGGVEVKVVPGDHYSIMREPHVKILAARLRECLLKSDG
jgi:thioesterase domain-containing protein